MAPVNPLVDVNIPERLGEGIEFPDSDIGITLAGAAPDANSSMVDGKMVVYSGVANDTSLAVMPTPTGLETYSILQSPGAPRHRPSSSIFPAKQLYELTGSGALKSSHMKAPPYCRSSSRRRSTRRGSRSPSISISDRTHLPSAPRQAPTLHILSWLIPSTRPTAGMAGPPAAFRIGSNSAIPPFTLPRLRSPAEASASVERSTAGRDCT